MIMFGIAEVYTGFSHNFFGIITQPTAASTYAGAALGLLYAVAGGLCIVRKRWTLWGSQTPTKLWLLPKKIQNKARRPLAILSRHATGRRLPKIFGQDYSYSSSKHP
jgi:hypothetical protein